MSIRDVAPRCPHCGAHLVARAGREGSTFLGCAAFPRCRFSRALERAHLGGDYSFDTSEVEDSYWAFHADIGAK